MAGWFKMYRSIQNHWIFEDSEHLRAWIYLLSQAAYTATDRLVQGSFVRLEAGELIGSERYLQKALNWNSRGKMRRFLMLLEQDGIVSRKTIHKQTILRLNNWEEYQGDAPEADHPPNKKRSNPRSDCDPIAIQSRTKLKKVNNFKKERSEEIYTPSPVVDGCEFFRMSDHERSLAEGYYRENKFPPELLRFAVHEVETWLSTNNPKAIKARESASHYRYLYAAWVLEKATSALQVSLRNTKPLDLKTKTLAPTRAQQTQNFLDQMLEEARAKEALTITQPKKMGLL